MLRFDLFCMAATRLSCARVHHRCAPALCGEPPCGHGGRAHESEDPRLSPDAGQAPPRQVLVAPRLAWLDVGRLRCLLVWVDFGQNIPNKCTPPTTFPARCARRSRTC